MLCHFVVCVAPWDLTQRSNSKWRISDPGDAKGHKPWLELVGDYLRQSVISLKVGQHCTCRHSSFLTIYYPWDYFLFWGIAKNSKSKFSALWTILEPKDRAVSIYLEPSSVVLIFWISAKWAKCILSEHTAVMNKWPHCFHRLDVNI